MMRTASIGALILVIVAITLVNFIYLLLQIVMAAEDCGVLEALPHVVRLLRRRTKAISQALAAILALMLMATGASILATTALGLIASGRVDLDALSQVEPARVTPWHVDAKLRLTPPDAARMHSLPASASSASPSECGSGSFAIS